jgi:hypothetical protein
MNMNTTLIIFAVLAAFGLVTALTVVAPITAHAQGLGGNPGFGKCNNPGINRGHGNPNCFD